jgi:L-asparaginase
MSPRIRLFVTGGTFDKEYDEIHGTLEFRETHLPDMLAMARSRLDVQVHMLMMVDSLEMTEANRDLIANNCREAAEPHVVITHGTDTMVDTARVLAQRVEGKTIVLTGAMIPIAFGSSDGLFNLGGALAVVQVLPPGVYITMNGRIFDWYDVRKTRETGMFEALRESARVRTLSDT